MASIITEQFRKNSVDLLYNDMTVSNNRYYVGLGKSDSWYEYLESGNVAPFPIGTAEDSRNIQHALTDLIRINASNCSYVIPRVTLTSSKYKAYNPYDPSCFYPDGDVKPCYFIDDDSNNIYLFVAVSTTSVLPQPNITNQVNAINAGSRSVSFNTSYIAVLIGRAVPYSPFNNEQFVELDIELNESVSENDNYIGRIYGFHAIDGGQYVSSSLPYTSTIPQPGIVSVYTINNSTPLNIAVDVSFTNGEISYIRPSASYYDLMFSNNASITSYDFTDARCTLSITISGVTSTRDAFIAPCVCRNGFGYSVREYTPSWYLGILSNSRESLQNVYSKYAQVVVVQNPKNTSGAIINSATLNLKKSFVLTGYAASTDLTGYSITQTNRKIGIVDSYQVSGGNTTVYYNSSIKHGFDTPSTGSNISFVKTGAATINTATNPSSVAAPNFKYGSADVIFIDNRASIIRSEDQNEELKIIIQL